MPRGKPTRKNGLHTLWISHGTMSCRQFTISPFQYDLRSTNYEPYDGRVAQRSTTRYQAEEGQNRHSITPSSNLTKVSFLSTYDEEGVQKTEKLSPHRAHKLNLCLNHLLLPCDPPKFPPSATTKQFEGSSQMGFVELVKSVNWEQESYPAYEDFAVLPLFALYFPSVRFFLEKFVFEVLLFNFFSSSFFLFFLFLCMLFIALLRFDFYCFIEV